MSQCQTKKSQRGEYEGIIREKNDSVTLLIDEQGRVRGEKAAVEAELDTWKFAYSEQAKALEDADFKLKNIKGVVTTEIVTKYDTLIVGLEQGGETHLNDSIISETDTPRFYRNEEWITLGGFVDRTSIVFEVIEVRDSLSFVTHWKRDGLFKPRGLEITAISANPYTKFRTLNSTVIKKPPPSRFGIGLSVGAALTGQGIQPYLGFGVNWNLIEF